MKHQSLQERLIKDRYINNYQNEDPDQLSSLSPNPSLTSSIPAGSDVGKGLIRNTVKCYLPNKQVTSVSRIVAKLPWVISFFLEFNLGCFEVCKIFAAMYFSLRLFLADSSEARSDTQGCSCQRNATPRAECRQMYCISTHKVRHVSYKVLCRWLINFITVIIVANSFLLLSLGVINLNVPCVMLPHVTRVFPRFTKPNIATVVRYPVTTHYWVKGWRLITWHIAKGNCLQIKLTIYRQIIVVIATQ